MADRTEPFEIRPARLSDATQLADVMRAAYAPFAIRVPDLPDVSAGLDEDIAQNDVWIAAANDMVIGGVVVQHGASRSQLVNLAVHPDAGGRGVGGALIETAVNSAIWHGATHLDLATHILMPENVALYGRLGWKETGRQGNKVRMTRPLKRTRTTMTPEQIEALPYRPCVGIMLVNAAGKVFVAQRIDSSADAWQMPQGGIDEGEDPQEAALRELCEETGVSADLVQIEAEAPDWINYELPHDLVPKLWKGRFRGQAQRWFLMRFLGQDSQISIETETPEFSEWMWAEPDTIVARIVPFKRHVYTQVLDAFLPALSRWHCAAP